MAFTAEQILAWVVSFMYPLARLSGFLLVVPIFGAKLVSPRIRVIAAVGLAFLFAPLLPPPPVEPFSLQGGALIALEIAIGFAVGFVFQLVFDAIVLAADFLALAIGLGFARLADPVRGASTPVLGQFYLIVTTLLFLAVNGHYVLLLSLAESWQLLPVGSMPVITAEWVAQLGRLMFAGGLSLAMPALVGMLLVNIAYALISRAAPALNLFAIGFPLTLLFGLVLVFLTLGGLPPALREMTLGFTDLMLPLGGGQ